jgi:hypothetical protein
MSLKDIVVEGKSRYPDRTNRSDFVPQARQVRAKQSRFETLDQI